MMNSVANDAIKIVCDAPPQDPRAFFMEISIKTRGSAYNDFLKNKWCSQ